MSNVKIAIKIKILLEGELTHMNKNEVESWFAEVFRWVDSTEHYKLGAKLRDAQKRWEEQLEKKQTSNLIQS
jgi:hypothetical protein